ncbi:N-acetylmuramoyl-L-alanine amidase (plasmid) [Fulvitalea axinellae]|uniref:N-acetylmuramoyl-L-alanine amidase n=1 Tax=Fulvitalea axinellae TaxID=1182444 RepID=A0AAU9CSR2_9BACT|nr:N-acetylmuramoyl-L-alanine amidase [Fulvitalea axinellae]
MRNIRKIVVHCSATPATMDIGRDEIDRWHRERKFNGIGYHLVIRRNGRLERGRAMEKSGAHAKGYNSESVGVCLVGGTDSAGKAERNFTPRQYARLAEVLKGLQLVFPDAEVLGHRDLPGVAKACPCFDVKEWWKSKKEEA